MERPKGLSPKRVWLQEEDCERMVRPEFEAVRDLMGAISYTASAMDHLQKRLERIPYGKQRIAMLLGGLRAIVDDLIGTMPVGQCRQIKNTMKDMEMRFVPKMSSVCDNVILEKENAKALIDKAMEHCHGCVEDDKSCLSCGLYKALESCVQLDTYENGFLCPYSTSEWKD